MIDLERTREQMVAEIEANGAAWAEPLGDPADPRFVSRSEARLLVRGMTPEELLPGLTSALSLRFAAVCGEQLEGDLLIPLKKAVGNAWKWGNRRDPAKRVQVETIVTGTGAFLAIRDEGEGFDVRGLLGRFDRDENWFTHGGSGFVHFSKARSLVSYADGGRTVLIRYLCAPDPGRAPTDEERTALGAAADGALVANLLRGRLCGRSGRPLTIESCHALIPEEWAQDGSEVAYVVEAHDGRRGDGRRLSLVGRFLPPAQAQADFAVAEQLGRLPLNGERRLRTARPVLHAADHSLVLYECDALTNLRGLLARVDDFDHAASILRAVALGLRVLHQSNARLPAAHTLDQMLGRPAAVGWRAVRALADVSRPRAEHVEHILRLLRDRAADVCDDERAPVHGDFGFHRVLCGAGRLHLFWYDSFRSAHPWFDVGGLLADLMRFYMLRTKPRPDFYRGSVAVVLETYFSGDPRSRADLPMFVAAALLLRLERVIQRPEDKWQRKIDPLLDKCAELLEGTEL